MLISIDLGVARQFQEHDKLPHMSWILPNAKENRDAMTTAWYMPTSWSPFPSNRPELEDPEDEEGMRESIAYLESLIDACVNEGIAPGRIMLGGFSQGCALSILLGLTSKKYAGRLAGIAGLMGYVPLCDRLSEMRSQVEAPTTGDTVPVFLARGTRDMLIPRRIWSQSLRALDDIGMKETQLSVREYDVGHALNGPVLRDLCAWLEDALPEVK